MVKLAKEGYQQKDIAKEMRAGRNTVNHLLSLHRWTGRVVPGRFTGPRRLGTGSDYSFLFIFCLQLVFEMLDILHIKNYVLPNL